MEKCKTKPTRVRRIIARDDVLIHEQLAIACKTAGRVVKEQVGDFGYWAPILNGKWDDHEYSVNLLKEVYSLLFDTVNIFDLRGMAKHFHLPARVLGKLITTVYDRICLDITHLIAEFPDASIVSTKIWSLDGRVGYEFLTLPKR